MKKILTLIFLLLAISGYSQSAGFYNKYKDPQGKYLKDSCYCPVPDTNHYSLMYAPNGVDGGSYTLKKAQHANYNYPVRGWWWADSKKEAKIIFKLKTDKTLKDTLDNVPQ